MPNTACHSPPQAVSSSETGKHGQEEGAEMPGLTVCKGFLASSSGCSPESYKVGVGWWTLLPFLR